MALGRGSREFVAFIEGKQRNVRVEPNGDLLRIRIDQEDFEVTCSRLGDGEACLLLNGSPQLVHVRNERQDRYRVTLEGGEIEVEIADAVASKLKSKAGSVSQDKRIEVRSPMHGTVVVVQVVPGNEVDAETPLVVLEAMKMQNAIVSPAHAVVREVLVESGQTVEGESVLVVLDRLDD
jgi:biotin carboxyl carrier protein